jgi:hypothetical protein
MNANKLTPVLYILLALAVLTTSAAWTPAPAAAQTAGGQYQQGPYTWPPKNPYGRVSARLVGDQIYIYGEKLPRNHDFFVKVRRGNAYSWARLGETFADKNGKVDDLFRLPEKLRKLPGVQVCLKDSISNKAYCTTARRNTY